jgi:hypothetical protein
MVFDWIGYYIDYLMAKFFSSTPLFRHMMYLFTGIEALLGGVFEAVADADFAYCC